LKIVNDFKQTLIWFKNHFGHNVISEKNHVFVMISCNVRVYNIQIMIVYYVPYLLVGGAYHVYIYLL
jgi:hypothetical protein